MKPLITYLLQKIEEYPYETIFLNNIECFFHNSLKLHPEHGNSSFQLRGDLKNFKLSIDEIEEIVDALFILIRKRKIVNLWLPAMIIGTTYCYTTIHIESLINLMKKDEKLEDEIKTGVFVHMDFMDRKFIQRHKEYLDNLIKKYPDDEDFQDTAESILYKYETGEVMK